MKGSMGLLPALLMIMAVFASGCTTEDPAGGIGSFQECVEAGYPVMESYPRQCSVPGGETFTEDTGGPGQGPVGGERDEHGCLMPAGYSWDPDVGACIRSWELDESEKEAAGLAVDYLGGKHATTVTEVMKARCPGCFAVRIERGLDGARISVMIENWTATGSTPDTGIDRYFVGYEDGSVVYNITVTKPTPCHYLNVVKSEDGLSPPSISLHITSEEREGDGICAQVMTEDTVSGTIGVDSRPRSVTVYHDGGIVYYTELEQAARLCTEEEKSAEMCTMEYDPVCGYDGSGSSMTYGNPCQACAAGSEYWEAGEC